MAKADFIRTLAALAQEEAKNRGSKFVLPSICIAQAALETGWGSSKLMTKANAYFGIKAGKSWKGKVYSAKTKECYDGINYTTITDCFRAYDSLADSVRDYYDLITGSSRYAAAVGEKNALKCITEIKAGGYATSPKYVKNVMAIVEGNNLTQYDSCVTGGSTPASVKSVEEVAREVIAGKWGNNPARKKDLEAAGYNYAKVQAMVNKLLKG